MDTELKNYIESGVKLEKVSNPNQAFAFISTGCHFSKEAVKQLSNMGIECKYYAIDRNQFVNENLSNIGGENLTEFWQTNVQHKCGAWSYPHIFFKNKTWHYVGGCSDIKPLQLKL